MTDHPDPTRRLAITMLGAFVTTAVTAGPAFADDTLGQGPILLWKPVPPDENAPIVPEGEGDIAPPAPEEYNPVLSARSWIAFRMPEEGEDSFTVRLIGGDKLDEARYPASLTKLMTFKLLADWIRERPRRENQSFTMSRRASRMEPTNLRGLGRGSTLTALQAANGLIIASANNVAACVGESLGGSESQFARRMTRVARDMGMANTTFRNASGLPDGDQVTTVRDIAILVTDIMQNYYPDPMFQPIFDAAGYTFRRHYHERSGAPLAEHDIQRIKSGFTRASGSHYAVHRDGAFMILMGAPSATARNASIISVMDDVRAGAAVPCACLNLVSGERTPLPSPPAPLPEETVLPPAKPEDEFPLIY